jgi:peptidyl-prolyl cis-trans isomerase B (cyclophilin B)
LSRRPILRAAVALAAMAAIGACSATAGSPTAFPASSGSGCPTAQPAPLPAGETRTVTIATALGSMTLRIEADLSPIAAGNFVALASCGYYNGVVFHRVAILDDGTPFVIQGGDPDGTGKGGPGYTIRDEPVSAVYGRGTVAMARSDSPNSVGSQFFIVLDDGARDILAYYNTYQIIGSVTAGMETADAITAAAGGQELPSAPVVMTDVNVTNP